MISPCLGVNYGTPAEDAKDRQRAAIKIVRTLMCHPVVLPYLGELLSQRDAGGLTPFMSAVNLRSYTAAVHIWCGIAGLPTVTFLFTFCLFLFFVFAVLVFWQFMLSFNKTFSGAKFEVRAFAIHSSCWKSPRRFTPFRIVLQRHMLIYVDRRRAHQSGTTEICTTTILTHLFLGHFRVSYVWFDWIVVLLH